MTIGERLLMGAAKIRRGEWCQGILFDDRGYACAIGATVLDFQGQMTESLPTASHIAAAVTPWIARAIGWDTWRLCEASYVMFWSDAPDRTSEQVADALELAALLWEQDQKPQQAKLVETTVGVGV